MREHLKGFGRIGVIAGTLALAACATPQGETHAPRIQGPPPQPLPPAEAPAGLNQPGDPALASEYSMMDRADALLDAIGDSPPDFSFSYDGGRLFAWAVGESLIVEEPREDGYVLYLFEDGQPRPFFLRTPLFAAGFDRDGLSVIYTREGGVFTGRDAWRQNSDALSLQLRGEAVYSASQRSEWVLDDARAWAQAFDWVLQVRLDWEESWADEGDWQHYRRRTGASDARRALREERQRRREAGERFRRWRDNGFAGPAPEGIGRRREGDRRAERRRDRNADTSPDRRREPNREARTDRPRDRDGDGQPDRRRDATADREPDRPRDRERPRDRNRPDVPVAGVPDVAPPTPSQPVEQVTARPPRERPRSPVRDSEPPPVLRDSDAPPRNGSAIVPAIAIEQEAERRRAEEARGRRQQQDEAERAERQRRQEERRQQEADAREAQRAEEARRQAEAAESRRQQAAAAESQRREAEAAEARRREAQAAAEARAAAEAQAAERRRQEEEEERRRRAEQNPV